MSTLILDSIKETITVTLRKKDAQILYNLIRRTLIDKENIGKENSFNNTNNVNINNDMNSNINNNAQGGINSIEELRRFNSNGWEQR